LLRQLLRRFGVPLAFLWAITVASSVRNDDAWTVEEQLAGKRQPTQFGRALEQLGITFIAAKQPAGQRPRRAALGCACKIAHSELRLAQAADINSATPCCANSSPTTTAVSPGSLAKPHRLACRSESLERICCFLHERIVSNARRAVGWPRFQIPQQARRFSFAAPKYRSTSSRWRCPFYMAKLASNTAAIQGVTDSCCR